MKRTRLLSLILSAAVLVSPASAQKPTPKTGAKPAAPAGKASPAEAKKPADKAKADEGKAAAAKPGAGETDDDAVAQFDKLFAEWKEMLAKLQDLRARYVVTPRKGGLRQPLKQEFDDVVKQGEELEPKVIAAAGAAFAVARDTRPEIGKFLAAQLKYAADRDDYERAVPIAQALIDNGYDNPRIYNFGGIAAFCTNQYDLADKWLSEGDQHSVLDVDAKQFLAHIKQYKDLWKTEQELREAEAKADDLPRVLLKTTHGDIVVELFENEAPNTVANFVSLVEKGFYNGVTFHRVLPHFMAQGGDPDGDGRGGPGYRIPDETDRSEYRNHFRGSLSMANTGLPDTGGSQFFLMFRPSGPGVPANLNGKHTVFGRVVDGFGVLARIQRIDPDKPEAGVKADKIDEAKVLRKRKHDYVPKKLGETAAETPDEKGGEKGE
ncbi:MAG TPA: peptidylprolyl isomerase [Pirellulales bacterium]|nr:peptidylprolyl isomerase [Pirellulales bacterium]